ncbi:MAG: hypothetical protein HYZ26_09065 [Chloroflexi bacterium]|nr:hypothetical protein [Chloroflexota bacterium]
MRRFLNLLLTEDDPDPLGRLLGAWRLWLAGALVGALAGWGIYAFFPPPQRAQASVIVDFNIEEAWVYFPERRLFHFLERESRKLEAVAWSDAALARVVDAVPDASLAELRDGRTLMLSHPQEGEWHFWAQDDDPLRAEALAAAWTEAFVLEARARVGWDPRVEQLRAVVNTAYLNDEELDAETLERLGAELGAAIEASQGLSPYLNLEVSQAADLPVKPAAGQGGYLLAGSFGGAVLLALLALFLAGERRD